MMGLTKTIGVAACMLAMTACLVAQQSNSSSAQHSGFAIAGVVISSADGRPLSRARVLLSSGSNRDFSESALTSGDGRFLFSGLVPGKYVLEALHHGFVRQGYQQHGSFFTGIAVGPGLPQQSLLVRLQPGATIFGKVVDEGGDPVREAQVTLLYKSLQNGEWATRTSSSKMTDDLGAYHFAELPPGRYFVAVSATPWYARFTPPAATNRTSRNNEQAPLDMAYPMTYYQDVTDFADATPLDLEAGQQAQADLSLTAVPAQHITVRLPDDSSNPSSMLSQRLADSGSVPLPASFTRIAPGVWESSGLAPGNYEMELSTNDAKTGRTRAAQSRTVEVGAENEVRLDDTSTFANVTGTVHFVPAQPYPPHSALMLWGSNRTQTFEAEISSDGTFNFERPIPPGRYQLSASAAGFYISSVAASGAALQGRSLQITGSGPVVLSISISRGIAQVTGTAEREGKAVSGALVVLVPSDPANNLILFRADQSDSDGTFTLPSIVPGKYTVVAIDNGWSLEWRNPEALKPYLSRGEALVIAPGARYNIKPQVQDF